MGFFEVGRIVNTQGINGEMRVISMSDDPKRFDNLKSVIVSANGKDTEYKLKGVRYHKQFVLIKLEGVNSINDALSLKNALLKVPDSMGQKLNENEYYIRDIYDCGVYTQNGEKLGIVTDILFTGANDVYVVKSENEKDILIPAIKSCIINVDIDNKKITVNLPEGLID
ncbi:MAG: ribosome maturation factor RimM [Clostridiales bacterium]|jgi:16S rRNA processing protein RimM|nr:ribosome maturation factor RimM [Clostridiales bacterium]